MKNLDSTLSNKALSDLKGADIVVDAPMRLEPTKAEINQILTAIKNGENDLDIRGSIRRTIGTGSFGFTKGQVALIRRRRDARIVELTPVEEVVIEEVII